MLVSVCLCRFPAASDQDATCPLKCSEIPSFQCGETAANDLLGGVNNPLTPGRLVLDGHCLETEVGRLLHTVPGDDGRGVRDQFFSLGGVEKKVSVPAPRRQLHGAVPGVGPSAHAQGRRLDPLLSWG